MLSVYLVEHIPDLLLGKSLCIKDSGEAVAFLLLVAQYGQDPRMEVAVSVARDAELKLPALAVRRSGTVAVPLVARIPCQELAALGDHHALDHDLLKVVETVFFRCMLAHQLGKL